MGLAGVLPCCVFDPEAGVAADIDMSCTSSNTPDEECVPLSLAGKNVGQPMVKIPEHMEKHDSSDTETDPEQELTKDSQKSPVQQNSGRGSPQHGVVCSTGVKSKTALAFHLKQYYPAVCLYHCLECINSFNNNNDLLVHVSNVHSDCLVCCKHCNYSATSKARMRLYV